MLDNTVPGFCHALPLPCIKGENSMNSWLAVCREDQTHHSGHRWVLSVPPDRSSKKLCSFDVCMKVEVAKLDKNKMIMFPLSYLWHLSHSWVVGGRKRTQQLNGHNIMNACGYARTRTLMTSMLLQQNNDDVIVRSWPE